MSVIRSTYGANPSQFGELSKPAGGAAEAVVVIVHGGFWRAQYGLELGRPLAADLIGHGYAAWNLEYRRVGNGGGWPQTFDDVAAGIDHLATLAADDAHRASIGAAVREGRIVAVGHSAGGHLAVWAAGRRGLPADAPGAGPKLELAGVVSQAGVLDLAVAADTGVGSGAPQDLLGGSPATVPQRYRLADPIQQVPLAAPVLCVHARADQNVPYVQSTAYVAAATAAGGPARLDEVAGDHFTLIDPTTPAWAVVRNAVPHLAEGRLPA